LDLIALVARQPVSLPIVPYIADHTVKLIQELLASAAFANHAFSRS